MSADRFARLLVDLSRRVRRLERGVASPQLAASSLEDGYIDQYDDDGNLVGRIGRQEDGSHGVVVFDGPTPPTPTPAEVEGGAGFFVARWNGGFTDAEHTTHDHRGVEVHVAETPDFEVNVQPNSPTRHASIDVAGGGSVTIAKPAGTYYVRLVTRTAPGKYGEASAPVSVEVTPVLSEEDLEALEGALDEAAAAIETLRDVDLPALGQRLSDAEAAVQQVIDTDLPALDARLGDAEDAITTTLPNAIEAAQSAAETALLIAPVSTEAPTLADGEGRPVNAIWTRIDSNGNEIGYWRWTGSEWTAQNLTPTVIPNLSASKITSGTLDTGRLNAAEVAAAVANVISLNADRITSGTIDTARLNAQEIAAAVATIIELNADRITSGTIDTDRLNASEIAAAVANVIELNADRITSGTINTARLNAQQVAAAVGSFLSLNADQITSGTISTARLDAQSIAAAVADFVTVKAENIQAGTVTADITLEGRLQTSATGQRVVVDDDAITQYDDDNEVIFSTADGSVHARGEFSALDEDGKGVIIGPVEPLNNKDSKAAIELPMNIPEIYARPPMIYTRGGYNAQDPDDSDFELLIAGAGIWDYWEESPTITLEARGDKFRDNDILNEIALDAEWICVNLKGTHPDRLFAVDTDDIRAFLVDALGDATVHRNLTAGGTIEGATVRATGQVQGAAASITGLASVGSLLVGGDNPFEDSGWIEVTPQNGYSGGNVYRRKVGKQVIINVGCTVGTASSGAALFTLPVGWRPPFTTSAAAVSNYQGGTPVQVVVQTSGDVNIYWPSGPGSNSRIRSNVTFFV